MWIIEIIAEFFQHWFWENNRNGDAQTHWWVWALILLVIVVIIVTLIVIL